MCSSRRDAIGYSTVALASLTTTPANNTRKPPAAITIRPRVRSIRARRARSGAVIRTVSIW